MEVGEYYYWDGGDKVIFRPTSLKRVHGRNIPCYKLVLKSKHYEEGRINDELTTTKATPEQIQWLEQCKAAGHYVEYTQNTNDYDIF